jgi:hypothetical protein
MGALNEIKVKRGVNGSPTNFNPVPTERWFANTRQFTKPDGSRPMQARASISTHLSVREACDHCGNLHRSRLDGVVPCVTADFKNPVDLRVGEETVL